MRPESTKSALESAVAGMVATGAMTAALLVLDRILPGHEERRLPPQKVAEGVADKAGLARRMNRTEQSAFTWISHFGYGTGMGTLYPYAARHIPASPPWRGILYGLGVWAASYAGWLPELGILPPPQRRTLRQNVLIIAAHAVWGAVLSSVAERSKRRSMAKEPKPIRASLGIHA